MPEPSRILDWSQALHALLTPIVIVSAIASMLLGLQRGYVGYVTCLRGLNARRRAGEEVQAPLHKMVLTVRLHATAIAILYLAAICYLLCACALGAAFFKIAPSQILSVMGLGLFGCGTLNLAIALFILLRDVSLLLKAVEEEL